MMRLVSRFAVIGAVLPAAVLMAVAACGSTGPRPAGGAAAAAARPPAPPVEAAVCLDGTSSSASIYAIRMRGLLAEAVTRWVPRPSNPASGARSLPGLRLVLRSVTTTSTSTDWPTVDQVVPGVLGLGRQPDPVDNASFPGEIQRWNSRLADRKRAVDAADRAASALAGEVRRYMIVRNTMSAIYNCAGAAAAQLAPAHGPKTRLAVVSDMENNEAVTSLHLAGDAVLVVEICPASAAATCPQRFAAARSYLLRHGASSVVIIRADAVTAATFDDFWKAG